MKKRIIVGAVVALLALTLAACGSSSANNGQGCGNVCHYLSFLTNIFLAAHESVADVY
jgi:predicted small secreted protein